MKQFVLAVIFIAFIAPSGVAGEIKEIISDGSYNMGDGETPSVAELRALLNAKRNAIEQAGTYVESYSKAKEFELSTDEVQILASGLMEVTILEKKRSVVGDGINFWVRINARVNPDKIDEMVKKIKEKSVVEDYKNLQKSYAKSMKDIERLKKELSGATDNRKKRKVADAISKEEKKFITKGWLDQGSYSHVNGDDDNAIKYYEKVIEEGDADYYVPAYINRAALYADKGYYEAALQDLDKARDIASGSSYSVDIKNHNLATIFSSRSMVYLKQKQYDLAINELNKAVLKSPKNGSYYSNRGVVYYMNGQLDLAIADLSKAISLNGDDNKSILKRGAVFSDMGKYGLAISDFSKVIEREPKNDLAYFGRGTAYGRDKSFYQAISDLDRSLAINSSNAVAYYNRAMAYYEVGQHRKARMDFEQACDMGHKGGCAASRQMPSQ